VYPKRIPVGVGLQAVNPRLESDGFLEKLTAHLGVFFNLFSCLSPFQSLPDPWLPPYTITLPPVSRPVDL
jgi:hypothetical protein